MGSLFSRSTPDLVQLVAPSPAPQAPVEQPYVAPLPPVMPSPPPAPAPVLAPLPPVTPPELPRLPQKSLQQRISDLQQFQSVAVSPTVSSTGSNSSGSSSTTTATGSGSAGTSGTSSADSPSTGSISEEDAAVAGLLDRRRSRFGTVLTGWTGVLTPNELVPVRRTLLGE